MGQITSGIGLISGLPTADIIDQLIAVEARPRRFVQNRITVLQSQQAAFGDINAKLLAMSISAGSFSTARTFDQTVATSSNSDVLAATSTTRATPGSYSFLVDRLVTTQQLVTKGFADDDTTAVGAGTLTVRVWGCQAGERHPVE